MPRVMLSISMPEQGRITVLPAGLPQTEAASPTLPAQAPPSPCPQPIRRSRQTGSIASTRARRFRLERTESPATRIPTAMTISISAHWTIAPSNGGCWTTRPTREVPGSSCCPTRCWEVVCSSTAAKTPHGKAATRKFGAIASTIPT